MDTVLLSGHQEHHIVCWLATAGDVTISVGVAVGGSQRVFSGWLFLALRSSCTVGEGAVAPIRIEFAEQLIGISTDTLGELVA
ncbi:MAG: hypothetical protein MK316_06870 [Pseudomonadales bacterium]|nr:hypothetical protein [Pseudomonadales bacterium]